MRGVATARTPIRPSRDPCWRRPWHAWFASIAPVTYEPELGVVVRRGSQREDLGPPSTSLVPVIEAVTGRHLALDIDPHGFALPVSDQRCLAKMSVHEFLGEFVAAKLEQLHVGLHPAIDRHGDAPRPREDLGVLDRHLVPDHVG